MIHWLTHLLGALTERRFRGFFSSSRWQWWLSSAPSLWGLAPSLLTFTFARRKELSAALIICFAYALLAILIGVVAIVHGRTERLVRRVASAPTPESSDTVHSLFQSLAEASAPQDREALLAAMQLGRALSPLQLSRSR